MAQSRCSFGRLTRFPESDLQFSLERAVEHGVKKIVKALAGSGLLGFHRPDFGDTGGEFIL